MLFKKSQKAKGIESFDPERCKIEKEKKNAEFFKDDVAMGCSGSCWSSCIGTCRRSQH